MTEIKVNVLSNYIPVHLVISYVSCMGPCEFLGEYSNYK